MIPSITSTAPNTQTGSNSATANSNALNPTANEQTFLQLLVAQLKNQDPTQPQDGTQFVAELAQFSSVEEELGMKSDLDNINSLLASNQSQTNQTTTGNGGTSATTNS